MKANHQGKMVLIVDDNLTNLRVLVDALSEEGFNVSVAKSGERALAQLEEVLPELILLDVRMPAGIDGFETCRRLKAQEKSQDIPVIFMTALSDTVDKVRGFEVGGVDYITKPFQVEEVLVRVQTHLSLRQLQQQLREEIVTKDKFFSIIAHDLKNPLISFLSFAKILDNLPNMEADEVHTLSQQFRDLAQNLFALLQNLLTWARLQNGQMLPVPQALPLQGLVQRNIETIAVSAQNKQILLHNLIDDTIEVYADLNMLDAVVRNLLMNALKFTKVGGKIDVSASQNDTTVSLAVVDTGIGIPEDKISDIFRIDKPFQREGTANEKGTGLGLILCKEFIEKNQGSIRVESQVGGGTTFTICLPRI